MNSYQSTIDSQEDSTGIKSGHNNKNQIVDKRRSKRICVTKCSKFIENIQIQEQLSKPQFSPQVRGYVQDIISYMSEKELSEAINENYMAWQTDINTHMREILVGWLIQVSSGLNLKSETLHQATLLVDKFCYTRNVVKRKYQLLGGACLFIAAKYNQILTPRLMKYVQIGDGAYNKHELLVMQSEVLLALNFVLQDKLTLTLFQIKCKQYCVPKGVQQLGNFLMQMCLIEYQFCRKKSSYISLAIVFVAMKLKKKKMPSTKVFASQNSLDQENLNIFYQYMLRLFSIRLLPKFTPVRKRYASSLFDSNMELK